MQRRSSSRFAPIAALSVFAGAVLLLLLARPADAQSAPDLSARDAVVETVEGGGQISSANPHVRVLAETKFDVARFRWPVPAWLSRILPSFYLGKVTVNDPGESRAVETASRFLGRVRPWGEHGAAGRSLAVVRGPWDSLAPDPVCVMTWYVDDLSGVDIARVDAASADIVAFDVTGSDPRCTYSNRSEVVSGDLVVTFVDRPQLKGELSFDQDIYVNEYEHVLCVQAPCPPIQYPATARYAFTVTNVSKVKSVSHFTSGCQHDVEILNADGEVVLAASDNRPCTDALTTLELAPGESQTYEGELVLEGRDGRLLPAGHYKGIASLLQVAGPGARARDAFAVRVIHTGVGGPTEDPGAAVE